MKRPGQGLLSAWKHKLLGLDQLGWHCSNDITFGSQGPESPNLELTKINNMAFWTKLPNLMSTKFAAIQCSTSLINTLLPVISGIMLIIVWTKHAINTLTNHPQNTILQNAVLWGWAEQVHSITASIWPNVITGSLIPSACTEAGKKRALHTPFSHLEILGIWVLLHAYHTVISLYIIMTSNLLGNHNHSLCHSPSYNHNPVPSSVPSHP